ncbi:MAG TPA: hypothetical protein ENN85_05855 [Methanoculleus sp.]|nr:hypothetical protein [Methanoculleus sp.]
MNLIGLVLTSPINPLAPLFRILSLFTIASLLWHRSWASLGMMVASMVLVSLLFRFARLLLFGAIGMVGGALKRRMYLL